MPFSKKTGPDRAAEGASADSGSLAMIDDDAVRTLDAKLKEQERLLQILKGRLEQWQSKVDGAAERARAVHDAAEAAELNAAQDAKEKAEVLTAAQNAAADAIEEASARTQAALEATMATVWASDEEALQALQAVKAAGIATTIPDALARAAGASSKAAGLREKEAAATLDAAENVLHVATTSFMVISAALTATAHALDVVAEAGRAPEDVQSDAADAAFKTGGEAEARAKKALAASTELDEEVIPKISALEQLQAEKEAMRASAKERQESAFEEVRASVDVSSAFVDRALTHKEPAEKAAHAAEDATAALENARADENSDPELVAQLEWQEEVAKAAAIAANEKWNAEFYEVDVVERVRQTVPVLQGYVDSMAEDQPAEAMVKAEALDAAAFAWNEFARVTAESSSNQKAVKDAELKAKALEQGLSSPLQLPLVLSPVALEALNEPVPFSEKAPKDVLSSARDVLSGLLANPNIPDISGLQTVLGALDALSTTLDTEDDGAVLYPQLNSVFLLLVPLSNSLGLCDPDAAYVVDAATEMLGPLIDVFKGGTEGGVPSDADPESVGCDDEDYRSDEQVDALDALLRSAPPKDPMDLLNNVKSILATFNGKLDGEDDSSLQQVIAVIDSIADGLNAGDDRSLLAPQVDSLQNDLEALAASLDKKTTHSLDNPEMLDSHSDKISYCADKLESLKQLLPVKGAPVPVETVQALDGNEHDAPVAALLGISRVPIRAEPGIPSIPENEPVLVDLSILPVPEDINRLPYHKAKEYISKTLNNLRDIMQIPYSKSNANEATILGMTAAESAAKTVERLSNRGQEILKGDRDAQLTELHDITLHIPALESDLDAKLAAEDAKRTEIKHARAVFDAFIFDLMNRAPFNSATASYALGLGTDNLVKNLTTKRDDPNTTAPQKAKVELQLEALNTFRTIRDGDNTLDLPAVLRDAKQELLSANNAAVQAVRDAMAEVSAARDALRDAESEYTTQAQALLVRINAADKLSGALLSLIENKTDDNADSYDHGCKAGHEDILSRLQVQKGQPNPNLASFARTLSGEAAEQYKLVKAYAATLEEVLGSSIKGTQLAGRHGDFGALRAKLNELASIEKKGLPNVGATVTAASALIDTFVDTTLTITYTVSYADKHEEDLTLAQIMDRLGQCSAKLFDINIIQKAGSGGVVRALELLAGMPNAGPLMHPETTARRNITQTNRPSPTLDIVHEQTELAKKTFWHGPEKAALQEAYAAAPAATKQRWKDCLDHLHAVTPTTVAAIHMDEVKAFIADNATAIQALDEAYPNYHANLVGMATYASSHVNTPLGLALVKHVDDALKVTAALIEAGQPALAGFVPGVTKLAEAYSALGPVTADNAVQHLTAFGGSAVDFDKLGRILSGLYGPTPAPAVNLSKYAPVNPLTATKP